MHGERQEIYFDRPGVATVSWDDRHSTVLVEWSGAANPDDFARLLSAELNALRDHQGSRLLIDCRRQPAIDPNAQDTADREWLPEAIAAGLKRFAVVLPMDRQAMINLVDRLNRVPASSVEVAFFDTVQQAEHWLDS